MRVLERMPAPSHRRLLVLCHGQGGLGHYFSKSLDRLFRWSGG
jgi:hypothetical protein